MNVYLLQVVNGIGIGMLYFLLAVGLSIIFGLLRFVNFAHGAFYLLGAYFCYQAVAWGLDFWLSLVAVPLLVGVLAWAAERSLLRRVYDQPHEFHILITVGLALVLQEAVILGWGPLGDNVATPDALQGVVMWGGFIYPKYRLFVIAFTAVFALVLWWLLEGTRLGSAVRAGSESTEMVSLLGINVYRVFGLVFALGAGTAALAGALAAPIRGVDPFMGLEALGVAFVIVVVGGMGSFGGALAGGLLIGIVQSVMSTLWPEGARLMIYVAMAAVLLLRPHGLLDIPRPPISLGGLTLLRLDTPWRFYTLVGGCFLAVFWLLQRVTDSVFGRTLLAIRENEARARAVGYDTRAFKLAVFALSGAVTALAGAFHALMTGIAPLSNIEYHTSEMILVMTVIGGTGNLFASVLGAAFYVLVSDWLSTLWPRWLMLLGFLLIAVSLFMHKGLWGLGERLWSARRGGASLRAGENRP